MKNPVVKLPRAFVKRCEKAKVCPEKMAEFALMALADSDILEEVTKKFKKDFDASRAR